MRSLEDVVLETDRALRPARKRVPRLMIEQIDDVADSARPTIAAKLGEIREGIRRMKESYGLEVESVSTRRRLVARLSVLGVELAECTSHRLRSLGELPKDEREALDAAVSRLEELTYELKRLIGGDD